jgi:glucose/arabinose dehydrogenase
MTFKPLRFLYLFFFVIGFLSCLSAQPILHFDRIKGGFVKPVDVASMGDNRLFVVEQEGIIRVLDSTGAGGAPDTFLDIRTKVACCGERGLLGLAFHPDYLTNGYFYVNYTDSTGGQLFTRIARYQVSNTNPDSANPASEQILMSVLQPYANHNAGDLNFGPDGFLYIGLGDGGGGGDPGNNAKNPTRLLGKMLRIDVDTTTGYRIPADNPFFGNPDTLPEIWALGLRNPWRFSFDALTGDMWIGDVGQNLYEEIDFQPASSTGGEHYGWRCYEGNTAYNLNGCLADSFYTFPVHVYDHASLPTCASVTGGLVYRGSEFPDLYGKYLFNDYCSGNFWTLAPDGSGGFKLDSLGDFNNFIFTAYGEGPLGEIYLTGLNDGRLYRLIDLCGDFSIDLSGQDIGCGNLSGAASVSVAGGRMPYSYSWHHGPVTPALQNPVPGTYSVTVTDATGCSRTDSVEIREFDAKDGLEPNDMAGDAALIYLASNGNTFLCPEYDEDWFYFDHSNPKAVLHIRLFHPTADLDLQFRNVNSVLAVSETPGSGMEEINLQNVPPGRYYIRIFSNSGEWDAITPYEIKISQASIPMISGTKPILSDPFFRKGEGLEKGAISICPNPATNQLVVLSEQGWDPEMVWIRDLQGKTVWEFIPENVAAERTVISLSLPFLANGMYLLQIKSKDEMLSGKFMIQR